MNYARSFFLNFLIVFFIDRVAPGIEIVNYENVPDIGADILFAAIVGFFNASVFFFLVILELSITDLKLGIITFMISFLSFILIAIFPFGVQVLNFSGILIGGTVVWAIAFLTNHLEWKHYKVKP